MAEELKKVPKLAEDDDMVEVTCMLGPREGGDDLWRNDD